MKRLRTVNGTRYIAYINRMDFEDKVQEVVTDHRQTLITRLMTDLNTYIDYKFHTRVDEARTEKIKDSLLSLKNQAVPIDACKPIVDELLKRDLKILTSAEYYAEIDDRIKEIIGQK